ncbi:NAD(P)-dependent oxidoreductase [Verrucomicrobia bacterium LW23]|nr:NAD(P)-dependent oxidoreductase [Verrucomicrobia bacterium LW23]
MNILLTGGTGFVGRHLVWRLCSNGARVIFTGRNRAMAQSVLRQVDAMREAAGPGSPAAHGSATFLELHHGAPGARDAMVRAAMGMDAIIHNAAHTAPWGRLEEFMSPNVTSTEEAICACKTHDVARMVHLSTPSLYFDYKDALNIRETDPLAEPVNSYAATKAAAERLVAESGVSEAVILRPRAIFGPWDNALLPRLIRAMERGPIPISRGGAALLDLTYIDNLVDAVLLAMHRPFARDNRPDGLAPAPGAAVPVYNISNGEPLSVRELFRAIAADFGLNLRVLPLPYPLADAMARTVEYFARSLGHKEPRLTRYTLGVLSFSQTLNLDRARRELGYAPRVSVRDGIRATARWWKTQSAAAGGGGGATPGDDDDATPLLPNRPESNEVRLRYPDGTSQRVPARVSSSIR